MTLRSRRPARHPAHVVMLLVLALIATFLGATPASADSSSDTQGTAVLKVASNVTLTASSNPAPVATDVQLTADIGEVSGNEDVIPTGDVVFFNGSTELGTAPLDGRTAVWTSQFPEGTQQITASYAGDVSYDAGISDALSLQVSTSIPSVTITAPGSADPPGIPTDGSPTDLTVSALSAGNGYPHTRFAVSLSGIPGLRANQLQLQRNTAGTWSDVSLTDGPSDTITGLLSDDAELVADVETTIDLRLSVLGGAPTGDLAMQVDLQSSTDGGTTYPTNLATQTKTLTLHRVSTSLVVVATSTLTHGQTGMVDMSATITPSSATGTVTFTVDSGTDPVGTAPVVAGVAHAKAPVPLGSHYVSATFADNAQRYDPSTATCENEITVTPPGGSLHALVPSRILDTRIGNGAARKQVPSGGTLVLQVTGRGGVPAGNVAAVSMNVTVVLPGSAGYVTLYPTGGTVPSTSNINFDKGSTTAGLVMLGVSDTGKVSIVNRSPSPVDLLADVSAWFSTKPTSLTSEGKYTPISPFRLLDTRHTKSMVPDAVVQVQIRGAGSGANKIPASGVSAVVLNMTVVNEKRDGYLTAYPGGSEMPVVSTLNYQAGKVKAGRLIVGVGSNGKVNIKDKYGTTDVVLDIAGWFTDSSATSGGSTFVPLDTPQRLSDSRHKNSGPNAPWKAGETKSVTVAGHAGVPSKASAIPALAVVGNMTVVEPDREGYLTAYPTGVRPVASDLNFAKEQLPVQNLTIATLSSAGAFNLYNYAGNTNTVIDVFGWFG